MLIDTDTLTGFMDCYPNAEHVGGSDSLAVDMAVWSDGEDDDPRVAYFCLLSGKRLSWAEVAERMAFNAMMEPYHNMALRTYGEEG